MDQFASAPHEAAMGDSYQMSLVETAKEAIKHTMEEPVDGRRDTFSCLCSSVGRPSISHVFPLYRSSLYVQ
ncbi:unnamed protein product [Linum trigynum]|uniref:Uncharacterized protein n=1 Tax=Linum trigynum TaxID=586398 RepID=A0AAV2GN00_9ROSI